CNILPVDSHIVWRVHAQRVRLPRNRRIGIECGAKLSRRRVERGIEAIASSATAPAVEHDIVACSIDRTEEKEIVGEVRNAKSTLDDPAEDAVSVAVDPFLKYGGSVCSKRIEVNLTVCDCDVGRKCELSEWDAGARNQCPFVGDFAQPRAA